MVFQGPVRDHAAMQTPMVWSADDGRGRNAFRLFRLRLRVRTVPATAVVNLFADARYRLRVNGEWAGFGPARFQVAHPEHDRIDIAPLLKPGANELLVEVHSPNANNYQVAKNGRGGLAAWGTFSDGVTTHDLATPGAWQVYTSAARDPLAPPFSFAQGPVEIIDHRVLAREIADHAGWKTPVAVSDGPWGPSLPRSIGLLPGDLRAPPRVTGFLLHEREQVIGCAVGRPHGGNGGGTRFPYATWIFSPRAQRVTLGLFWGPHALNGVELKCANDAIRGVGARQNADADFIAGWNLLYGEPEMFTDTWAMLIGLPKNAGLIARAVPDKISSHAMRHGESTDAKILAGWRGPEFPADAAALARLTAALGKAGQSWHLVPVGTEPPFPARRMAWDEVAGTLSANADATIIPAHHSAAVLLDFGSEKSGWLRAAITAPAGTLVDVCNHEEVRADGLIAAAHRPFVETADRFICVGGTTTIEAFHVRGGRYWQVTVRPPPGAQGDIRVENIALRSAEYDLAVSGRFACGDATLDWLWQVCIDTLRPATEDVFVDSFRERGLYLADAWVESLAMRAFSRDQRMERRCLLLFAQGREAIGNMQGCTPSWFGGSDAGSFPLIWVHWLRSYWESSGDHALARELLPHAAAILHGVAAKPAASGLWDVLGWCDWGQGKDAQNCAENGTANAFRHGSLNDAADLAEALGDIAQAKAWRDEAAMVRRAMRERLWDAGKGCYAAGIGPDGNHSPADPIHANVVALATECHDADQAAPLLAWVAERMAGNVAKCAARVEGRIELYFLVFVIAGFYRHDRADLAERVMHDHFAPLRAAGVTTLPERFLSAVVGDSHCHAWDCHPAWFMQTRILGVRPLIAGEPDCVEIAPEAHGLTHAEGVVAHRRGDLRIAWRVVGRELHLQLDVPPGVTVGKIAPRGALAALTVKRSAWGQLRTFQTAG